MQIYAYDERGEYISSLKAKERKDYYCPDCHDILRVRSGPFIRTHFYHFKPFRPCSRKGKTLTHLRLQETLVKLLPPGEAVEEAPFPSICRIADIYWEKEKIVFEAQVSFISAREVEARNRDYASLGLTVVWILHKSRFDGFKVTNAERFLRNHPHYFSNHNEAGHGQFYDRHLYEFNGIKQANLFYRKVNLSRPKREFSLPDQAPLSLQIRSSWPLAFEGDILTSGQLSMKDLTKAYELEAFIKREPEKEDLKKKIRRFFRFLYALLADSFGIF